MTHADTIRHLYTRLDAGDFKPFLDHFGAQSEWHEAENIPYFTGEALIGTEEVMEAVFARVNEDFEDFHVEINRVLQADNTVWVEGRYVGTTKAGKHLSAQLADVWDFEGEKIVKFQQYSDTWQWRQLLDA